MSPGATRWRSPDAPLPPDPLQAQAARLLRGMPVSRPLSPAQRTRLRQRVLERDDDARRPSFVPSPLGRALSLAGVAGLCALVMAGTWMASRSSGQEPLLDGPGSRGSTAAVSRSAVLAPTAAPATVASPALTTPSASPSTPAGALAATTTLTLRTASAAGQARVLDLGQLVARPSGGAPRLELLQRQVAGHEPLSLPRLTESLRFVLGTPGLPTPALAATSTLAEEADLLARAVAALHAAGPAAPRAALALETLERHARRFPAGILAAEAARARIEALRLAGRAADADAALARLPEAQRRTRQALSELPR